MTLKGFTLIEIVVTLLILSVVAALSVPAFLEGEGSQTDLDAAQRRLEALFHLARDSAVRTATPITVALDSTTGFAWLDARSSYDVQLMDSSPATDAGTGMRPLRAGETFGGGSTLGGAITRAGGLLGTAPVGQPIGLPATVTMELFQARVLFTFSPSGAVIGDSIRLRSSGGQARMITLDPWIARIHAR
jgi:prepilin-type N-terminal cleavage/methylation domain-containing protein